MPNCAKWNSTHDDTVGSTVSNTIFLLARNIFSVIFIKQAFQHDPQRGRDVVHINRLLVCGFNQLKATFFAKFNELAHAKSLSMEPRKVIGNDSHYIWVRYSCLYR